MMSAQFTEQDQGFMQLALSAAQRAADSGEVPVGAVLTVDDVVVATGYNQPISLSDPTAHAEIIALRAACQVIDNYRLPSSACLYVTLEPCTMCVGALIHARLPKLIYATTEPRAGAVVSTQDLSKHHHYNHRMTCLGGLCAEESSQMLKAFFKARRR